MTIGERGKTGDHGQDGRTGATGATGTTGSKGAEGRPGEPGPPGRNVLTTQQTLTLFGFIVFAFTLLAFRMEYNADNIQDGVVKHDKFVQEICTDHPEYAPISCENRR